MYLHYTYFLHDAYTTLTCTTYNTYITIQLYFSLVVTCCIHIVSKDVISVSIAFHSVFLRAEKIYLQASRSDFLELLISSNPVTYLTLKHSEKGL